MYKYVLISTVQRGDLRGVMHELSNDDGSTHSKCPFVAATVYHGEKECPFVCLPVKLRFSGMRPLPPQRSQSDSHRKGLVSSSLQWINIDYLNHMRFCMLNFKNKYIYIYVSPCSMHPENCSTDYGLEQCFFSKYSLAFYLLIHFGNSGE